MNIPSYGMIIEGLANSRKVESTDISGVATPEGKVGEKKIICPKCKSENVNIRDNDVYHCVECGYEWAINGKEVSESMVAYAKGDAFSKISIALSFYAGYGECNLQKLDTGMDNEITMIGVRAKKDSDKANKLIKDFGFVKGKAGAHSKDVPDDTQEDYVLTNASDITDFLKFLNKETKKLRGVVSYKSLNEGVTKFKTNQRYKTIDGFYIVVKNKNKDGTYTVYDEDSKKDFKCEVSDLELLRLTEV